MASQDEPSLREQVERRLRYELHKGSVPGFDYPTDPAKVADWARALSYLSMIPGQMGHGPDADSSRFVSDQCSACWHPQQDHGDYGFGGCWCKCERFVPDELDAPPPRLKAVWAAAAISPIGYHTITSVFLREEDARAEVDKQTEAGMRFSLDRLPINYPESE